MDFLFTCLGKNLSLSPYQLDHDHTKKELLYNGKQKWGHYIVDLMILAIWKNFLEAISQIKFEWFIFYLTILHRIGCPFLHDIFTKNVVCFI